MTLGQGHRWVSQYISPDLYFLCPKYLRFITNGFDVRGESRCGGSHSGGNELKTWSHPRLIDVQIYRDHPSYNSPVAHPTSSTHTHPDHASCAPFNFSRQPSWRLRVMWRCRMRSRAMSRSQSMVWKSSYCPIPGGRSSNASIKLVDPAGRRMQGILNTMYMVLYHFSTLRWWKAGSWNPYM